MKHFLRCLLYIAALGVVFFVVGRLVPKSWFKADHFPWRCYSYEQAIWKALRVKQWQAKVPDMSRIFTNIMPAKKLKRQTLSDLPKKPVLQSGHTVSYRLQGLQCYGSGLV